MDYQNISFSALRKTNVFSLVGDGFWYVDATPSDGSVDTRIRVTADNGNTIVLKPGQHFRLENAVLGWTIASMTGAEAFTGNIIVGNGDFGDDVLAVKLDATLANNVTVVNGAGAPVPVSIQGGAVEVTNDAGNPLPVSLSGVGTVQENLVAYTGAYTTASAIGMGTAVEIVSAAANTAGITIHSAFIEPNNTADAFVTSFLAKATAPASVTDGDMVMISKGFTGATGMVTLPQKVRIPAGKGLYIIRNSNEARISSITYTKH